MKSYDDQVLKRIIYEALSSEDGDLWSSMESMGERLAWHYDYVSMVKPQDLDKSFNKLSKRSDIIREIMESSIQIICPDCKDASQHYNEFVTSIIHECLHSLKLGIEEMYKVVENQRNEESFYSGLYLEELEEDLRVENMEQIIEMVDYLQLCKYNKRKRSTASTI